MGLAKDFSVILKEANKYQRHILIKFPNWIMTSKVLEVFLDQPYLQIFLDLNSITLEERRELNFLTSALIYRHIKYRGGFPFKLVVLLDSRTVVVICTYQEARNLCEALKGEVGLGNESPANEKKWVEWGISPTKD